MNKKKYAALVGGWDWDGSSQIKGISLCEENETGWIIKKNILPDVKVGSRVVFHGKELFYFVDEKKCTEDRAYGGGGYVYAAKKTGDKIEIISKVKSLAVNPCDCEITKSGKYLLVVHHTSTKDTSTKLVRTEDHRIQSVVSYDDAALVLFRLKENGEISEAVDFDVKKNKGSVSVVHAAYPSETKSIRYPDGKPSMLHGISTNPDTAIFLITDKGLDKLYSYKVDEKAGRLICLDELQLPLNSAPRYCIFHPYKNLCYINNEAKDVIYLCSYDKANGKLQLLKQILLEIPGKSGSNMASDMLFSNRTNCLYLILRTINKVVVIHLDCEGMPICQQYYPAGGQHARGLAIRPDEKRLYVCNTESDNISAFEIADDGSLNFLSSYPISRPSNLIFIEEE